MQMGRVTLQLYSIKAQCEIIFFFTEQAVNYLCLWADSFQTIDLVLQSISMV